MRFDRARLIRSKIFTCFERLSFADTELCNVEPADTNITFFVSNFAVNIGINKVSPPIKKIHIFTFPFVFANLYEILNCMWIYFKILLTTFTPLSCLTP